MYSEVWRVGCVEEVAGGRQRCYRKDRIHIKGGFVPLYKEKNTPTAATEHERIAVKVRRDPKLRFAVLDRTSQGQGIWGSLWPIPRT